MLERDDQINRSYQESYETIQEMTTTKKLSKEEQLQVIRSNAHMVKPVLKDVNKLSESG